MIQIALLHLEVALEHRVFLLQSVRCLRLLEQLHLRHVLLVSKRFELLTHQVHLLLQKEDLAVLSINQMLFPAQIDLQRTLLLLQKRDTQHVLAGN